MRGGGSVLCWECKEYERWSVRHQGSTLCCVWSVGSMRGGDSVLGEV